MDKMVYERFMGCIKTMRKFPKSNMVMWLSSNNHYDDPCYLDIFRRGPNNYIIKFDSPVEGRSWKHEGMELKFALAAVNTWFRELKDIDKYKYMEY